MKHPFFVTTNKNKMRTKYARIPWLISHPERAKTKQEKTSHSGLVSGCLLYTSDAADDSTLCRSRWSPYH